MDILASISNGAVGGLLGGIGTLAKDIRQAITGDISADKQAEIAQKALELENQLMIAQATINLKEAESEKLFVAGWRPFIGWMCGISFAYATVVEPLLRFVAKMSGYSGTFPELSTVLTLQVLVGMLGLGVMRSVDKAQDPSPKGKE